MNAVPSKRRPSAPRRIANALHARVLVAVGALAVATATQALPPKPGVIGGGKDPGLVRDVNDKDLECLVATTASLSLSAEEIPLGGKVNVRWNVQRPSDCRRGKFLLSGYEVAADGSRDFAPLSSQTYFLVHEIGAGRKTLAQGGLRVKLPPVVEIKGGSADWKGLLVQALGTANTTVRLAEGLEMDLSGYESIPVATGVTLTSEREVRPAVLLRSSSVSSVITLAQRLLDRGTFGGVKHLVASRDARNVGPRIFTKTRPRPLFQIRCYEKNQGNVRFFGFRLHGPTWSVGHGDDNLERGIMITSCRGVEIANMELAGWSGQAIYVMDKLDDPTTGAKIVHIHDNFFHHNQHEGGNGYGVVVQTGGYAAIERNVFDFNRHGIAASGDPGVSYDARWNLVLKGGGFHRSVAGKTFHTHQFDVHGDDNCGISGLGGHTWNCGNAGDQFRYEWNAFQFTKDNAIKLRGKPRIEAVIKANVFAHDDQGDAVALQTKTNVRLGPNKSDVDSYGRYGVCDFDGDGRDDLFLPTGVTWWTSSFGKMHWVFFNAASERIHELLLGDFDGDRRCDVLAVHGTEWKISSGGNAPWKSLGHIGVPLAELRVGDFDGDGRDDLFRSKNRQWSVISPGVHGWRNLNRSEYPLSKLRLGDFDGDRKTDVLSLAGGQWSVSWGGVSRWQKLNTKRSDKIERFVIADVRGDGRDDVLVPGGIPFVEWKISDDGKGGLVKLDIGGTNRLVVPQSPRPPLWFWGRFDDKPGADALALDPSRMGWIASAGRGELRQYGAYAR